MFGVVAVAVFPVGLLFGQGCQGCSVISRAGRFPFRPESVPIGQDFHNPVQQVALQNIFAQLLNHIADARPGRIYDPAAVRLLFPIEQTQEGGLACAVGAAYAQARAVGYLQGKIRDNGLGPEGFAQILNGDAHKRV